MLGSNMDAGSPSENMRLQAEAIRLWRPNGREVQGCPIAGYLCCMLSVYRQEDESHASLATGEVLPWLWNLIDVEDIFILI